MHAPHWILQSRLRWTIYELPGIQYVAQSTAAFKGKLPDITNNSKCDRSAMARTAERLFIGKKMALTCSMLPSQGQNPRGLDGHYARTLSGRTVSGSPAARHAHISIPGSQVLGPS